MRNMMLTMEMERAQMIAEVEDQIRMITVQIDPDEFDAESRPSSRMSTVSAPSTLRKSESHPHILRASSTQSTLVESASMGNLRASASGEKEHRGRDEIRASHRTSTVPELDEPEEDKDTESVAERKKRFSATRGDLPQDGMAAVDDALSHATALVNQSISNIQRRVSASFSQSCMRLCGTYLN